MIVQIEYSVDSSAIVSNLCLAPYLGDLLLLCSTLKAVALSGTIENDALLSFGGWKMFSKFYIASFVCVSWSRNSVFGCGYLSALLRASSAITSLSAEEFFFLAFVHVLGRVWLCQRFSSLMFMVCSICSCNSGIQKCWCSIQVYHLCPMLCSFLVGCEWLLCIQVVLVAFC